MNRQDEENISWIRYEDETGALLEQLLHFFLFCDGGTLCMGFLVISIGFYTRHTLSKITFQLLRILF